jgi:fructose-bisphosphate aldolase, class I
MRKRL